MNQITSGQAMSWRKAWVSSGLLHAMVLWLGSLLIIAAMSLFLRAGY